MAAINESSLRKTLSKMYKYRDLTARDITSVTSLYKDLKPVMDSYGKTLLNLLEYYLIFPYKNIYKYTLCSKLLDVEFITDHFLLWYKMKNIFCCVSGPTRDGTIGEDTIRASLVSAVSDKLRRRMKEEMDRAQAELDALKRTEEDLKRGHQKLEEMVTKLDLEMADVDKNVDLLKQKDDELTAALGKMEKQSENNDIDDVILPTAPLYKQILNLYAEENAIEDTIFYLGEALRRDVIDLDVFLKHVRLLSRKQFQLRALMQKARKIAGLSDLY
uniref:Tumor susceptibility 101b n=1 Tax=Sinocyclocheilus rhinocerous TaxID=307959 RepID=A0A673JDC0_9TELE